MVDRALVAVNAHRFHDATRMASCLRSVAAALDRVKGSLPIETRVFCDTTATHEHAKTVAAREGFATVVVPGPGNGARLNAQLQYARAMEADVMFRVDADDTVDRARFHVQLTRLNESSASMLGGGLRFVERGGRAYPVIPPRLPDLWDFLLNRAVLHPALAIRVPDLVSAGIGYPDGRLEDKALVSQVIRKKLMIENLPMVLGDYHVGPNTRDGVAMALRNLSLNLSHLAALHRYDGMPAAVALFGASSLVPNRFLRRVRQWL